MIMGSDGIVNEGWEQHYLKFSIISLDRDLIVYFETKLKIQI